MKQELFLPFEYLWNSICKSQKNELEEGGKQKEIQWPSMFLEFLENPEQYIKNNNLIEYFVRNMDEL